MKIINLITQNPLVLSALTLTAGGMMGFWIKDIPLKIWNFILKEFTTELILTSQNTIFHDFLKWLEVEYRHNSFRKIKLSNGKWGNDKKVTIAIGYGNHIIKFKNKFLFINLIREKGGVADVDKETVIITKFGRSRKIFDELIQCLLNINEDNKIEVYNFKNDYWAFVKKLEKRNIDTVFIEKTKLDLILLKIKKFTESEAWYIRHAIPYQLGILFYGTPGTGKTSLIKALAAYLNYPIYVLAADKINHIADMMSDLPPKALLVIEDIDCSNSVISRNKDIGPNKKENVAKTELMRPNLSTILNTLDGLYSLHGRILIATTNHIEKLDTALLRPGRIDLKIEFNYVNSEIFEQFINHFFPNNKIDYTKIKIKENITTSYLQELLLEGNSITEIIEKIKINE